MAGDREKISDGLNERRESMEPPSDEQERKIRDKLEAPTEEVDTLPLEGE